MRRMKRALSLFLCCIMLMSLVTINTFAAENDSEDKQAPVSTEIVQQTEDNAADADAKTEPGTVNDADTVVETTGITADLFEDDAEAVDEEDAAGTNEKSADTKEDAASFDREKDT